MSNLNADYTSELACETKGTFSQCSNTAFTNQADCIDSSNKWHGFGDSGPSGTTTTIPLTTTFNEIFDGTDCDTEGSCYKTERNLFGNIDINYGYKGSDSCESCPSGLSIWSNDPSDHVPAKCRTCKKGYVGLATAAACQT